MVRGCLKAFERGVINSFPLYCFQFLLMELLFFLHHLLQRKGR